MYPKPRHENGCVVAYDCTQTERCPAVEPPKCELGTKLFSRIDQSGCLTYSCDRLETCRESDKGFDIFARGSATVPDSSASKEDRCIDDRTLQEYYCDGGNTADKTVTCENGCKDGTCLRAAQSCGNYKCDENENNDNCPGDCIPTKACPVNRQCEDGSTVACTQNEYGCRCDQCSEHIPQGCRQEKDEKGFVRVVCERACSPVPKEAFDKCHNAGGRGELRKDPSGCEFLDCRFGGQGHDDNPILGSRQCPKEEQTANDLKSCEASGLKGFISFEGGCKVAQCQREEKKCSPIPEDEKRALFEGCRARGNGVYKDFDENGCVKYVCGQENTCKREAPSELFKSCGQRGGQVAIRRDEKGCIAFADCVQRGDERHAAVEDIDEVPQTTEMLGLVFKLERLRIEFDKLARDSENIADYYKSTGAKDEARYRRAAAMFDAGKNKIDEIRTKIKDALEDLTKDDVLEIRSDIRYIKDVMLKDILYIMLGEGDDIKEIEAGTTKDCKSDGRCFNDAMRLCKPVKFSPEGRKGPRLEITGLEGDACVLKGVLPEDQGPPAGFIPGVKPPYEMTCKIKDYALGIKGPQDILPHCEGPLAEMAKQFGGAAVSGENFPPPEGGPNGCKTIEACVDYCIDNYDNCVKWTKDHPSSGSPPSLTELRRMKESGYKEGPGMPGVPGKCSGRECEKYCSSSSQAARDCLKYMGNVLPPEAKQGLEMLAEGKQGFQFQRPSEGEGFQRPESGGFQRPGTEEFQRPGTDEFQRPSSGGYQPPSSGGHRSTSSGGDYRSPTSGGYNPPSSGSDYQRPSSDNYQPPSSGGYAPPSSGGYQPPSSGGYQSPSTGSGYQDTNQIP